MSSSTSWYTATESIAEDNNEVSTDTCWNMELPPMTPLVPASGISFDMGYYYFSEDNIEKWIDEGKEGINRATKIVILHHSSSSSSPTDHSESSSPQSFYSDENETSWIERWIDEGIECTRRKRAATAAARQAVPAKKSYRAAAFDDIVRRLEALHHADDEFDLNCDREVEEILAPMVRAAGATTTIEIPFRPVQKVTSWMLRAGDLGTRAWQPHVAATAARKNLQ